MNNTTLYCKRCKVTPNDSKESLYRATQVSYSNMHRICYQKRKNSNVNRKPSYFCHCQKSPCPCERTTCTVLARARYQTSKIPAPNHKLKKKSIHSSHKGLLEWAACATMQKFKFQNRATYSNNLHLDKISSTLQIESQNSKSNKINKPN